MGVRLACSPSSSCLCRAYRTAWQTVDHNMLAKYFEIQSISLDVNEQLWSLPLHEILSHHLRSLYCTTWRSSSLFPLWSSINDHHLDLTGELVSKLEVPSLVWTEAKKMKKSHFFQIRCYLQFHLWTPSPSRRREGFVRFVIFKIVSSMLQFIRVIS